MRSIKLPSWSKRLLGLDPLPPPPHAFGLAADRLRYGMFAGNGGGIECREFHGIDLDPEIFGEGVLGAPLRDPEAFQAKVRELLAQVSLRVTEASLVLPDSWLRVTFAESAPLPRTAAAREELLRWKLKRLVPFRVEELRLSATEAAPLATQQEPHRLLLGFAIDLLLRQLEDAFEAAGVRIGFISSESLALMAALGEAIDGLDLGAAAFVTDQGYSLVVTRRGLPLLHRFKPLHAALGPAQRSQLVRRDLVLTRSFLEEQVPDTRLGRLLLLAPEAAEGPWRESLEGVFEQPAASLAEKWSVLGAGSPNVSPHEAAPLLGAASREVR